MNSVMYTSAQRTCLYQSLAEFVVQRLRAVRLSHQVGCLLVLSQCQLLDPKDCMAEHGCRW